MTTIVSPTLAPVAPARTTPTTFSPSAAVALSTMATVGLLALWCLGYALVLSGVQEHRTQSVLHDQLREALGLGTAPVGGTIAPGTPVAFLQIPQLGVHDLVVVEGTTATNLQDGPGHRRDTPLPGEAGTSVVFGRSVLFGGPFAHIASLRVGDRITAQTGEGSFVYSVDRVRRAGDVVPGVAAGTGRLTLVTSETEPGGLDRHVVYVDATLQGTPQTASKGRPTVTNASEAMMHGDNATYGTLLAWLIGLVAAIGLIAWALERWGRKQALFVAAPVILALGWGATEAATRLLPNLF